MSIIAMMAVNCLFHKWFEAQQVPIQPLSFVDDWQLLVRHHVDVQHAMSQLQKFCDMIDLTVGCKENFCLESHQSRPQTLARPWNAR